MKPTLYLDRARDAELPIGVPVVLSEVDFFRRALSDADMVLQGQHLCSWGETFFRGRSQSVQVLSAISDALRLHIPTLTEGDIDVLRPLFRHHPNALGTLEEIATVVLGSGPWPAPPDAAHAAYLLAWWLEPSTVAAQRVAMTWGHTLLMKAPGMERVVYDISAPEQAWTLWEQTLGLVQGSRLAVAPPLSSTSRQHLGRLLKARVAAEGSACFLELCHHGAAQEVLKQAAVLTEAYLAEHPQGLNQSLLQALKPHLEHKAYERVRGHLPPPVPTPLPDAVSDWQDWLTDVYLPYRTSLHADQAPLEAQFSHFAERFLSHYSAAMNQGVGKERLLWNRSAQQPRAQHITLIVVCDGLSWADHQVLMRLLEENDFKGRLTLLEPELTFAPLPTLTRRAKYALFKGVAPQHLEDTPDLGPTFTQEGQLETALTGALPGDLVFWNVPEPDKTYHDAQSVKQARSKARGQLGHIAERLLEWIDVVPQDRALSLVITTDHGRLLSSSHRTLTCPPGFKPEGRACLGQSDIPFPASGYLLEGELARLSGARFGVAEDMVVSLSGSSFKTSDGKGGELICPHGGISPEEVLIPWTVVHRDLELVSPKLQATGSGTAGQPGTFVLELTNPNAIPLTLEWVRCSLWPEEWTLRETISPLSSKSVVCPWTHWPSQAQLDGATLEVGVRWGSRAVERLTVQNLLETQEMYARGEDILGDLGL